MLEWIGFIFLVVFGIWVIIAGYHCLGKEEFPIPFFMIGLGCVALYLALSQAPFHIIISITH